MATTDSPGSADTSAPKTTTPRTTKRGTGSRRSTTRSASRRTSARRTTTTSTAPKTTVRQVQELAERAVLVPVGASLLARDNLVSTVRDLATKYATRTSFERELKRYEKRGASARNRFERQVRRTRTKFERQLRQRRSLIERTVKQNRRRVEREVRSVRKDLGKQSGLVGTRVEKLVSDAQGLISQIQ
jgi:hypothetical protein